MDTEVLGTAWRVKLMGHPRGGDAVGSELACWPERKARPVRVLSLGTGRPVSYMRCFPWVLSLLQTQVLLETVLCSLTQILLKCFDSL